MKKKGIKLFVFLIVLIIVVSVTLNVVAVSVFDGLATAYFGTVKTAKDTESGTTYYESKFKNAQELFDYETELSTKIAEEGVVLLKNEDGALPLEKGETVSLFGTTSVDMVAGGSGSGAGASDSNIDMKTACEAAGLSVNEKLWDFYATGNGAKDEQGNDYGIGPGSIQFGYAFDWSIGEVPVSRIQGEGGLEDSFDSTTAVYMISRTGGEDGDLPRDMAAYGGNAGQHYLELDDTEKGVVEYLNEKFDKVVIIVNSNNPMELGWVDEYENVKAVISAPGPGRMGAYGVANVLVGYDGEEEISPSGHLVDTFVYDNYSSPAMQNMGDFQYTGSGYYYLSYSEGIYVGYRYYETRYEDVVMGTDGVGNYDYDETVQYPFGHGLSYTSFAWSDYFVSEADENGDVKVSLTVENVGERSGKEVVQLYFQSPYTEYDKENQIEKAAVELCGFAKTKNLKPGESETVEMTVNLEQFRTYDANGYQTYILDEGTYYLTAAGDAHKAVDNILAAKGFDTEGDKDFVGTYVQEQLDADTYGVDAKTGVAITNQFDHAVLADAAHLSRLDWQMMENDGLRYGTAGNTESPMEQNGVAFEHEISEELKARLDAYESLSTAPDTFTELPDREEDNGLELVDMRGLDFEDEKWDDIVAELSLDEMRRIVYVNGYSSLGAIESINKPTSVENDGPSGINDFQNHAAIKTGDDTTTMSWPVEVLLASTWNADLAREMGECIGEDGLYSNTVGWYGPAMNIHRTPFAGRNFEYYSEDPYISGALANVEVNAASSKGLITYIKHFAVNDQETHRSGVATWALEQAIREIYLEPFEMAIKNNVMTIKYSDENGEMAEKEMDACLALMTSFNRIGATWAGGNYNLLTNVLRTEWGFTGIILTDYNQSQEYMDTAQMLKAGGGSKLRTLDSGFSASTLKRDANLANLAAEAAHYYLYAQAHSAITNNLSHGVAINVGIPVYKLMLAGWDLVAGILVVILVVASVRRKKRK